MADTGFLTVVVTTRNAAAHIESAIESAHAQIDGDPEIIVVDDHSRDTTRELVRSFPNVTLLTDPNPSGIVSCRNLGAEHATGTWIAFLDGHDTFSADKALDQIQRLDAAEANIAIGHAEDTLDPELSPAERQRAEAHPEAYLSATAGTLLIRRSIFQEAGGFEPDDVDGSKLIDTLEADGHNIIASPEVVLHHRIHASNLHMTRRKRDASRIATLRLIVDKSREDQTTAS